MALIRLILIILAIYFGFHYIIKPLLRLFLQHVVKKLVEKEFQQFRSRQEPKRAEGSIHVDYVPEKDTKKYPKSDTEGEYIDYEEVK